MPLDGFELRSLLGRLLPSRLRRGEYAAAPLCGYLDRPVARGEALTITGWVVARGTPIENVLLVVGGREVPLLYRLPRPDVAEALGEPWTLTSGFSRVVPIAHDVAEIEIWAQLRGGRRIRAFTAPIARTAAPPAPEPLPPKERVRPKEPRLSPPPAAILPGPLAELSRMAAVLAPQAVVALEPLAPEELTALKRGAPAAMIYEVGAGAKERDPRVHALDSGDAALGHFTNGTVDLILARDVPPAWRRKLAPRGAVVARGANGPALVQASPDARALLAAPWPALPLCAEPLVSIVIPVHGKLALTLACLRALAAAPPALPYEVIVVDDASPDQSRAALGCIPGLQVIALAWNAGFIEAANRGAAAARGRFLVFLNNDTEPEAGWLDALHQTFVDVPEAGLVGAKLVLTDGTLQEAGCLFFRDGSAMNFGRGDDPERPEYNYLRDVDYCSGACVMVDSALFRRLGGFDPQLAPAYYEDGDLAFRIRKSGLRVLYQPLARVRHVEGATSGTDTRRGVKRFQVVNQEKFRRRWQAELATYPARPTDERLADPDRRGARRLLVIDHVIPRVDQDSGSVRMAQLLRLLGERGFQITFAADNLERPSPHTERLARAGIEVLYAPYVPELRAHLERHGRRYHAVLLSKRDPAGHHLDAVEKCAPDAVRIFDTVDLHFVREERAARVAGDAAAHERALARREEELAIMRRAHYTIVVSEREKELLEREHAVTGVHVLGNLHRIAERAPSSHGRRDLLFVGYFVHEPNLDAMRWFAREIWPETRRRLPGLKLHVVGRDPPADLAAHEGFVVHGQVRELEPLLDGARLLVAPLRFGAGVKGKITQALARGLPVVTTSVGAEGMALDGEVRVADEPSAFAAEIERVVRDDTLWAELSARGLEHARRHFSIEAAAAQLDALLAAAGLVDAPPLAGPATAMRRSG